MREREREKKMREREKEKARKVDEHSGATDDLEPITMGAKEKIATKAKDFFIAIPLPI